MSDEVIATDEFEFARDDDLFQRLWAILQEVESGRADEVTVERWNKLGHAVSTIMGSFQMTTIGVSPHEQERMARDWIQAFMDRHWPEATWH